jgi:hypothetical protein
MPGQRFEYQIGLQARLSALGSGLPLARTSDDLSDVSIRAAVDLLLIPSSSLLAFLDDFGQIHDRPYLYRSKSKLQAWKL